MPALFRSSSDIDKSFHGIRGLRASANWWAVVNIPYSALMGVISPNSLERTSVSSFRFVLAYGGLFMVQGLTIPMLKRFGRGNHQRGFQLAMVVYGVLAIALFLTTFFTTRERVQTAHRAGETLKDDLRDLLKNVHWVMVCFIGVFAVFYIFSLKTSLHRHAGGRRTFPCATGRDHIRGITRRSSYSCVFS
jgi:Na+/melibiose symporter-like transporter